MCSFKLDSNSSSDHRNFLCCDLVSITELNRIQSNITVKACDLISDVSEQFDRIHR